MNKRIRSLIDTIFCEMKMTAENLALRDELMANAIARFEDAIAQGKTEEEAFAQVAASLEDVNDLLREMNADAPQADQANEEAPAQETAQSDTHSEQAHESTSSAQTDLGDALNKAFSALGSWGQSIMPQAKNLAKQMDDATGGVLRDIGRAVNKGMQDAQKAASDVLDKYQRPAADPSYTVSDTEKTPEELREDAKDLRAQAELKRVTGDAQGAQMLDMQAEALDTKAALLEQDEAIRQTQKAAEVFTPDAAKEEIFGADGELNEDAFARSVDQMTRDAEDLLHGETGSTLPPQENEVRFPAAGLRKIDVKLDADNIIIEPIDGDVIIVRWSATDAENAPDVTMQSHALTIRRKNPDVFKTFFSVFSKDGEQITLFIPRGYGADYALSTTSGDIRLTGLDVENVKISSTSGSIRIEPDLSARAEKIKAETVSGSVTISAVAADIEADSVSGDVFISCDAARVKGDVVTGKLHMEGACDHWDADVVSGSAELLCTTVPTGNIKIDTISGSAKLYLPACIRGFAVSFDSMGGTLTNEFGADHFGTCSLPIHMDTISGKMAILRL